MKAEEIIEVINDFGAGSEGKWTERLREAVYCEISDSLRYSTGADRRPKSLAEYVLRCYSVEAVELVLKLVNAGYEHLIMESIERFISEKNEEKK